MDRELRLDVDRESAIPLGLQLAGRIQEAIAAGALAPGEQLPSVRKLAEAAGVNVNTVRSVYARLEADGLVRSEQGRGTFAAGPARDDAARRRELRREIARLEAALTRLPPPPTLAAGAGPKARRAGASLLSTDDLGAVRDDLLQRLRDLETQRTDVLRKLESLEQEEGVAASAPRRESPSLAGARIRWVGA